MQSTVLNLRIVLVAAMMGVVTKQVEAQVGACCLPDGNCVTVDEASCDAQEGTYRGDGSPCDGFPTCGACVGPFGACAEGLTLAGCLADDPGSEYLTGSNGECSFTIVKGTCCLPPQDGFPNFPDPYCDMMTPVGCKDPAYMGDYGGGSSCNPEDVCPIGACCPANDLSVCNDTVNVRECVAQGWDWHGDGNRCKPDGSCPIPATSTWGCVVLALMVLVVGTIRLQPQAGVK